MALISPQVCPWPQKLIVLIAASSKPGLKSFSPTASLTRSWRGQRRRTEDCLWARRPCPRRPPPAARARRSAPSSTSSPARFPRFVLKIFRHFSHWILRFNSWQNNKYEVVKWETLRSPWSVKQADNTLTILCQTRKESIWNFLMAITSIKHVWMIKYQAKLKGGQEQQRKIKLYHLPNIPNVSGLRNLWKSYLQSLSSPKTLTLWSLSNMMPSYIRQIL